MLASVVVRWSTVVRATESLITDYAIFLSDRHATDPQLVSTSKVFHWNTRLETLGWAIDTESSTVSLPQLISISCGASCKIGRARVDR